MYRLAVAILTLLLAVTTPVAAQAPGAPPQASLFGAWIGGIFDPPVTLNAQECLAQPTVIFTRDVVLRAVMTTPAFAQRLIDSAQVAATGLALRLVPRQSAAEPTFGCPDPDVLPIQRHGDNQITFPGCTDFPFPLIRCSGR